jgi:hypothetical protein
VAVAKASGVKVGLGVKVAVAVGVDDGGCVSVAVRVLVAVRKGVAEGAVVWVKTVVVDMRAAVGEGKSPGGGTAHPARTSAQAHRR